VAAGTSHDFASRDVLSHDSLSDFSLREDVDETVLHDIVSLGAAGGSSSSAGLLSEWEEMWMHQTEAVLAAVMRWRSKIEDAVSAEGSHDGRERDNGGSESAGCSGYRLIHASLSLSR